MQTLAHSVLFEIAELASYDEDTPQVVQFAQWAKERAQTLSRLFGLHVKEGQTNIAIVNKFLRRIGYKSKELKRTGIGLAIASTMESRSATPPASCMELP